MRIIHMILELRSTSYIICTSYRVRQDERSCLIPIGGGPFRNGCTEVLLSSFSSLGVAVPHAGWHALINIASCHPYL